MKTAAIIIGIFGVALYISSYQFKNRKVIVAMYSAANILYVLQYIFLGAYSGMAMDSLAFISSLFARKMDKPFIRKYHKLIIIALDLCMVVAGMLLYKNIFSLFSIVAVIVETSALWCTSESKIRKITLVASPFWLTYNLAFSAIGSAVGNIINIVSLSVAILRYDILKKKKSES